MGAVRSRKANRGTREYHKWGERKIGTHEVRRRVRPEVALLEVVETVEDDETGEIVPVLVADVLLAAVRRNLSGNQAAKAADVPLSTYRLWLSRGAEVAKQEAAKAAGEIAKRRISKADEAYWWFWREHQAAEAEAERRLVTALDALGTGEGLVTETVTEKVAVDDDGNEKLLERTKRTANVLPDKQAAEWLLARRFPERWGSTDTLEVVGAGGGPVEHRHTVEGLEDMIAGLRTRMLDPIDTTAAEIPEIDPETFGDD